MCRHPHPDVYLIHALGLVLLLLCVPLLARLARGEQFLDLDLEVRFNVLGLVAGCSRTRRSRRVACGGTRRPSRRVRRCNHLVVVVGRVLDEAGHEFTLETASLEAALPEHREAVAS